MHRGSSRDVRYEVFESGQRIGSIIRKKLNFIKSGYSLVLSSHAFIDFRLTFQGQVRFTDSDGSEGSIDVDFRKKELRLAELKGKSGIQLLLAFWLVSESAIMID